MPESSLRNPFHGKPHFPRLFAAVFLILAASLMIVGTALWWPRRGETSTASSDLGLTLLGGGLALAAGGFISIALFIAERRVDAALRASDESRERTGLQLALSTAPSLEGIDLSGRDLCRFVLRGKNMSRANLSRSELSGADLSGATLANAYLAGANLREANLTEADLSGSNLEQTDLSAANLSLTRLTNANLHEANLVQALLVDSDLSGASFAEANLNASSLRGADLSGARLTNASLAEANLTEANLSKADFTGADLLGTRPPAPSHVERPARLDGARHTEHTSWPEGFDPVAAGAQLLD